MPVCEIIINNTHKINKFHIMNHMNSFIMEGSKLAKLNPEKLSVEFRRGISPISPIIPRRYTLTHSDITAELFLTIGLVYAQDKITSMRDEVLAQWQNWRNQYFLKVFLQVDGESGSEASAIRNMIFRRELPLALEAIRYGDSEFFNAHPQLDYSPIIVYFNSSIPSYNKIENWGTPADYKIYNNS